MNIFRDIRYIKRILQNMLILSRGKSLPSINLPLWIVLFKRKWQEKKKKKGHLWPMLYKQERKQGLHYTTP